MKKVNYSFSLVTYLDVLGFQKLIEQKSAGQISRLIRIVKQAATPAAEVSKAHSMQSITFSDTTVRVTPLLTPLNMKHRFGYVFGEILSLVHVQFELALESIILRGGIAAGDVVKSWGVLYGPGLVKAYHLEKAASWPRIVIDPELFRQLRRIPAMRRHSFDEELEYIRRLTRKDRDGVWFIDYLRAIGDEMEYPEHDYPEFLRHHAKLISSGLSEHRTDKHVREKYSWLREYHNSTVDGVYGKSKAPSLRA